MESLIDSIPIITIIAIIIAAFYYLIESDVPDDDVEDFMNSIGEEDEKRQKSED